MAKAKRQIKINRKKKEPVVEEKTNKKEAKIEEITVDTVIENEIRDTVDAVLNNVPLEEENVAQNHRNVNKKDYRWTVWASIVTKPKGRIEFEAQVAPVPLFKLPADIRQYLVNKGLSTNVWKKSKEWLEKHHVDEKMVERLKEFLSNMD